MPDMSRENIGGKSQKPGNKKPDRDETTVAEAEANGKLPPSVDREINQDMPDIASQIDVLALKPGTRFLARFVNDPTGDTGRQAKENYEDLKRGTIVRHGLRRDYWVNHSKDRPPIAISGEKGKFTLLE